MAKWKIRAKRVYREWRANFIVWAIQWIGGSALIISIWHAILQEYRRDPVDWMFFGIIFGIGVLLILFSFWKQSEKEPQYSKEELDGKLAEQRDELEKKIPIIMVNGKRIDESSTQLVQPKNTIAEIFTPLQIEAFTIAKDLRDFVASLDPFPGDPPRNPNESDAEYLARVYTARSERQGKWRLKLMHGYANRKFGERITALMHRAGEEVEYPAYVPTYAEQPPMNVDDVRKLAQQMEMVGIWINRKQRNEVDLLH